jgi:2-polyprenyl-6-methoxyphenol hydroxylase-like FAD-dependent oxidoreductase
LDETTIIRGADVSEITQTNDNVQVYYKQNKSKNFLNSRYLIGCDGKKSIVRTSSNIEFKGEAYPDCYMMGDFEDNTVFGSDAAVYLHEDGLIESFPLPNDQRRWVVKTDVYIDNPKPSQLKFLIKERIQHHLEETQNFMISSFGVQQYSANSYHANNILLAGDSAHIVSPIGGQGMNLGWLDAEEAVYVIVEALKDGASKNRLFQEYSNKRRTIAKQVARRAEMNMHLGRKETSNLFYKSLLKIVLNTRLNRFLAHIFTMRGLGRWWI